MYQKNYHIHFTGIGGIGMSGIAELLLTLGYNVSGSDIRISPITDRLESLGATICKGHNENNIKNANVIVTSTAIAHDNPEVTAARNNGIPIIPRAEMLAELMRIKYAIAVSGAHGKTSTTAMIAHILNSAGLDPTVVIGGLLKSLGTNALHGKGEYIVAEADESDGSFLKYAPAIAAVTNIDLEHLDFYKDIEDIKEKFIQFINSVPFYGLAVLCLDNEHIQDILPKIHVRHTTFGLTAQADLQARDISFKDNNGIFQVVHHGETLGNVTLSLAGRHNISNALAAIAVALELNVPFETIKCALEKIEGVKRRMEVKGYIDLKYIDLKYNEHTSGEKIFTDENSSDVIVMDDYGHHPTEIATTLQAIRESRPNRRMVVVFQPHRYTRTRALFDDFTRAFNHSDILISLPIYAASEAPIEGVNSESLCQAIRDHGHKDVLFVPDTESCLTVLKKRISSGDLVLTLGAGNVYRVGEKLLEIM
ncbi:UDP-N-acetylmuramate:L-alanine ligase [Desulfamplus magnetovallimortis]|uniref:UDP-N-acetylmuramate--L-alanine ligase n=1 Tax=Desulfamplus magnetovallimortis TaxID=1246637 RepID=A0A1W1HE82_9BACT|nr:UDP-N-acetylmuramate--L-alanine ligase [Desulfamplus magnetovallimortis]SLM30685.1 UDP-N-acetylmuramate:L-alanine ligase [Desulfamplus magnetovallimortis]